LTWIAGRGYRDLPTELGASEKTVRRRMKAWNEAGLWTAIHQRLLTNLRAAGRLDLEEVLFDGGLIKTPGGEDVAQARPIEAELVVN